MITPEKILEIVSPVRRVMPDYHPSAADINESLDTGVASCAAWAYGSGLLIRNTFPNELLYPVSFGIDENHGDQMVSLTSHEKSITMGHAVVRLWVPEQKPLILETFTDKMFEVVSQGADHDRYQWLGLEGGYSEYLNRAGYIGVGIDPADILKTILRKNVTSA